MDGTLTAVPSLVTRQGFLQGPATNRHAVGVLMEAVRREQPVTLRLTNYTKAGLSFVHHLSVEPLRDPSGVARCFQATSIVLQAPGSPDLSVEGSAAAAQLPLISQNPLPPLWPLLGQAVRPEPPSIAGGASSLLHSALGYMGALGGAADANSASAPASAAPTSASRTQSCGSTESTEGMAAVAAALDGDDDAFLGWLRAGGGVDAAAPAGAEEDVRPISSAEEGLDALIDEMQMSHEHR